MRFLVVAALCVSLGGCFASAPEVKNQLGQEYIGKNVDVLVRQWGPPGNSFRMNSGETSYVWQLAAVTDIAVNRNGTGRAATNVCKVSVIASPLGIINQLNTEDNEPGGGSGLLGLAGAMGAYGSMCAQRLSIQRPS